MVNFGTIFKVTDNSGVKKILGLTNLTKKSKKIFLGDLIVGVIKDVTPSSKLIYSNIVYGVVVRLKKPNSSYLCKFNDNAVVLVDKNLNPIGSRIFGSIPRYLKEKNCLKLSSLTLDLI